MIRIEYEQMYKIAPLFKDWDESMIWSCLDGCMGMAWADNIDNPKAALIVVADFGFVVGDVQAEEAKLLASYIPKEYKELILVPQNEGWSKLIEKVYQSKTEYSLTPLTRYAIKKEENVFDIKELQGYVNALPKEYRIVPIDETLFYEVRKEKWSAYLTNSFLQYSDFLKSGGIGFVVLKGDKIVNGVSTYTYYKKGVEIEIDTHPDFRRKRLGLACASKFILECLSRGRYPSWDAMNIESATLAEKLGYHVDKEYRAYFIIMKEGG